MAIVLFNKTKQEEKFGRNDAAGTGFAIYANAEVIKAEYERETEGKKEVKLTSGGSKKIKLAVRVQREISREDGTTFKTGEMMFISTFEKEAKSGTTKDGNEWSFPALKLKDLKPETTIKDGKEIITKPKYVRITAENGGKGIAGFDVSLSIAKEGKKNAGEIQSTINVRMPNIEVPYMKEGKRFYKAFNKEVEFKVDERAYVRLKGFFDPIKSTEEFLEKNVDKEKKTLKVRFFYSQAQKKEEGGYYECRPVTLLFKFKDFENDVMGDFGLLKAIKEEYKDKVVCVSGHLEQNPIYSKAKSKAKRQFGKVKNGDLLGYEVMVLVSSEIQNEGEEDEWVSFSYEPTGFDGKLQIKKDDAPLVGKKQKTETEKSVDEDVDSEDIDDVEIDDEEIEDAEIIEDDEISEEEDDSEIDDEDPTDGEEPEEENEEEEEMDEDDEEELPPPPPKKVPAKKTEEKKPAAKKEVPAKKETPKKEEPKEEASEGLSDEELDDFGDIDLGDVDFDDMD